jgi:hypothetical protein
LSLQTSAVGDTLCTLSIDSDGASFALSRASPRPGLPSTHSSSRPGLQHPDVHASIFGLAPTPLASHARANREKSADKKGLDASSATTVDDSSTDIDDGDDSAPLISPWTGRKAPLVSFFLFLDPFPPLIHIIFFAPTGHTPSLASNVSRWLILYKWHPSVRIGASYQKADKLIYALCMTRIGASYQKGGVLCSTKCLFAVHARGAVLT